MTFNIYTVNKDGIRTYFVREEHSPTDCRLVDRGYTDHHEASEICDILQTCWLYSASIREVESSQELNEYDIVEHIYTSGFDSKGNYFSFFNVEGDIVAVRNNIIEAEHAMQICLN